MPRTLCYFITLVCLLSFAAEPLWAQSDSLQILSAVNSAYDEQAPVVAPGNQELYFTIAKHPQNAGGKTDPGDIWMAGLDSLGNWAKPTRVAALSNEDYNAVAGFSPRGDTIFLHGRYSGREQTYLKGLSYALRQDSGWSELKPLTVKFFKNVAPHQSGQIAPHLGVAILSLEAFAGRGAEDLYVAFRQPDGSYTGLKNMGSDLNTANQEMSPWMTPDGKRIYFSSNGWGGRGRDLYVAERLDDTWTHWSRPIALPDTLNRVGVDWYPTLDPTGAWVYFVSNKNSQGYGDIYRYRLPVPEAPLVPLDTAPDPDTATVIDSLAWLSEVDSILVQADSLLRWITDYTTPVGDTVPEDTLGYITRWARAYSLTDSAAIPAKLEARYEDYYGTDTVGAEGVLQLDFPDTLSEVSIRLSAVGYFAAEADWNLAVSEQDTLSYYLAPLQVGSTVNLETVLFRRGTPYIIPESFAELDEVVRLMEENPKLEIELGGHTDNRGNPLANLRLSEARVDAVKAYLVEAGIASERITGKGYGGQQPIADNEDEELRKLNRRVELKITRNE